MDSIQVARVYLRVSTNEQDLARQERIVNDAKEAGYYVAGVYREKASGARLDRPVLLRLIEDLQPGEALIAERMDRVTRLPLQDAEELINAIKAKGARLVIPGVVDLTDVTLTTNGASRVVLESIQEMLLKLALQMARDDYEDRRERQRQGIEQAKKSGKYKGRKADEKTNELIVRLRQSNTIEETARLAGCSKSQVKRIWALYKNAADRLDVNGE
ncbi:recombinase family protein [Hahella ganghwensis]|uniref:recombinase family protein n=1 Tax=Hahella ganghwensis TaxID=286420 RepID=UPI0003693A48|nr:recombinase family protein [Hahella ganghwensis]